jgi:subfamily B ATP-binding cassette protein MsbA
MVPPVTAGGKSLNDQRDIDQSGHMSTGVLARRLLQESVQPYLGWLIGAVVCMGVVAGTTALSAWLMEPIVNEVFIGKQRGMLWLVGGAVLATFTAKGIANYAQSAIMSRVGFGIIADTQKRLYDHLTRMDLTFFQEQSTGRLISRFTNDINNMRLAVSDVLTSFGKDFLSLIGLVGVMFVQDWELALISFFVFPAAVIPIARLGKRIRRVTANTQNEAGLFTTLLEQTIQGIRVVKAYGMEGYERGRVAAIIDRIFRLSYNAARIRALSSPVMEALGGLAIAVVIVYGGYRVIEGQTDAGSFFSFITALLLAYEPMKRLANLNATLQSGLAGAERLYMLLDIQPQILDKPDAKVLPLARGALKLNGITFEYVPGIRAVRDLTLDVPAGKTVALVGPSGAGKSTLFNLILRFYDVEKGSITIDGGDIRDVTLASLRQSVALVSQEITLFDDTVRANIAYGRAGASDDDIAAAARFAAAHDFIRELPEGYDTLVGERGLKLSGGQRQRLAIARAMLKNAPILLLDEATSALDSESERQVQTALSELMRGRTTLVIAHRLSTVVNADLIHVIVEGRVVESGRHDELLAKSGFYAKLYALQFAEENGAPALAQAARA